MPSWHPKKHRRTSVFSVDGTSVNVKPHDSFFYIYTYTDTRLAQHNVQAWKASISMRSYHEAAFAVSGNTRPPHLSQEEIMNLTTRPINVPSAQSLTPLLCYACHTTLTSRSNRGSAVPLPPGQSTTVPLPMWVHHQVVDDEHKHGIAVRTTKMAEKEMKVEIGEFLLPAE